MDKLTEKRYKDSFKTLYVESIKLESENNIRLQSKAFKRLQAEDFKKGIFEYLENHYIHPILKKGNQRASDVIKGMLLEKPSFVIEAQDEAFKFLLKRMKSYI